MRLTKNKILDPEGVSILKILQDNDFKAYFVGGCVRDMIMGRTPHDWDIATSAKPEEVTDIFSKLGYKVIPTGLAHGTVSIVGKYKIFEITTFRTEGKYEDSRHPSSVSFVPSIEEDLARRDFTINAMAYSPGEPLIDPYKGYRDICKHRIKAVGDANIRFKEDPLRIMRAMRFSAQLNFSIESATLVAMLNQKEKLNLISKERINAEFIKILMGNFDNISYIFPTIMRPIVPEFSTMAFFDQHSPYHDFDLWEHTARVVNNVNKNDLVLRLAALFHDVGKLTCFQGEITKNGQLIYHFKGHPQVSVEKTKEILKNLRFSNNIIEEVCTLIKYHDINYAPTKKFVKRLLNKVSEENLKKLLELRAADILGQKRHNERDSRLDELKEVLKILDSLKEEEKIFSLRDLAISGNDLLSLGIKEGPCVGKILNILLEDVLNENAENNNNDLITKAKEIIHDAKSDLWHS